jgi:DNA-binding MarR family transcriptional regulator
VTKQAVQPLVAELADVGVVRIELDPDDARARRVHLTDFGVAALAHGAGILRRIEAEIRPHLGSKDVEALKRLLAELLVALEATMVSERSPPAAARPPSGRRSRSPSRGR